MDDSPPPLFRAARHEDLAAIVALLADDPLGTARETAGSDLTPYASAFEEIVADGNRFLAVLELDGQVAGCLQLSFIPGLSRAGTRRGQIEGVRIAHHARATSRGRAFLEWAIEECRRRGCGLVQLTTDKQRTGARAFYERLGFSASHEGMKLNL